MRTCSKCGAQLEDNVKFCDKCGAPVETPGDAQGQNNAQVQAAPPAVVPYNNAQPNEQPAEDTSDHTAEFTPEDISDNKVIAMCPYIFNVLGIIIALLASKESPYVAFHVRQALKLYVCLVLAAFFNIIPFLGLFAFFVWSVITVVLMIIGFVNVCSGKAKELPIVSSFGFLK